MEETKLRNPMRIKALKKIKNEEEVNGMESYYKRKEL